MCNICEEISRSSNEDFRLSTRSLLLHICSVVLQPLLGEWEGRSLMADQERELGSSLGRSSRIDFTLSYYNHVISLIRCIIYGSVHTVIITVGGHDGYIPIH